MGQKANIIIIWLFLNLKFRLFETWQILNKTT